MASSPAFLTVAKSNQAYFPEAMSNDLIIGTFSNSQRILFGVADNPSLMQISNSNISIGGQFKADMVAVGGQIVGTGTSVVFSPIAPGWKILDDNEGTGIGIGLERVQVSSGFLQWANSTTCSILGGQLLSNISNLLFDYDSVVRDEKQFSKSAINFTGKYISQDFALQNNKHTMFLTGPGGLFTIGFDIFDCDVASNSENFTFRCYYNKSTDSMGFQNYYSIKGSQFITVMLPSYGSIKFVYNPADNQGVVITPYPSNIIRLSRISVIE